MSDYVVGLTGGIGAGKTAVSDAFAALGVNVVDADVCAREVVSLGSPALNAIKQRFGNEVIAADGSLNRPRLRQIVFTQPEQKQWLNDLLHPLIRARMLELIAQAHSPYCLLVVPLLLENNMQNLVQRVVVVDVPEQLQIDRVLARDGSDEETVKGILQAQLKREERLSRADDIIDNSQSLEALNQQVKKLHQQLLEYAQVSSNT
ncbi:dephospho-CoA kinase [Alteromonas flava]|uniref:dephospho-CoA kinase n=1 Tax=Alteromonas flava TaxID=2048003 RepID=UPI001F0CB76D|nr:dephospho-CoA kinase [Alteromonas flava]